MVLLMKQKQLDALIGMWASWTPGSVGDEAAAGITMLRDEATGGYRRHGPLCTLTVYVR